MSNTPNPHSEQTVHSAEPELIRDRLAAAYDDDEMLFLDPPSLDTAIVGVAERINFGPVVVYDRSKLVQAFVQEGMTEEEADEWVSFNVEGAYVGERTPLILCSVAHLLP
jgi:hypothetical protein